MEQLLKNIELRKQKLEFVKCELKEKFVGIDNVIDKIIDNISLWYLMPEIQFRPLIISLWGITGVGKTDLVRNLVRLLGFTDKFIEIQMDLKIEFKKNVEDYLEYSEFDSNEPCILLLDEIQRYRTINEMGEMIENNYFNDVWTLLSDGKFQNNSQRKAEVMNLLLQEMYFDDDKDNTPSDCAEEPATTPKDKREKRERKYQTSSWTASRYKKLLNLTIPTEDIMKMNFDERIKLMNLSLKDEKLNDGKSYEKMLIFISGNLDEAFKMSDEVEDCERDADIYHELSKRINTVDIKYALTKKFKPEQIARFGNNHIIYPCLDRKSYYKIIQKNCFQILKRIEQQHNIKITLSDKIFDVIYNNGVFPTQGVRPVISTIFNILGSNLPHFLYHALISDKKEFHLDIKDCELFSNINNKLITKQIVLDIDDIRNKKSIDERMLVIAHEISHALIYSILYNTPPKQININSSGYSSGFIINHSSVDNKTFLKNKLAIYLAGLVAEEIVFGEDYKSSGSCSDIEMATHTAALYVRSYGMDGTISKIERQNITNAPLANFDVAKTNEIIENLLVGEKTRCKDLLNRHIGLYKSILKHTIDNNSITVQEFVQICKDYGLILDQKEINDEIIYEYDKKLKDFLKN